MLILTNLCSLLTHSNLNFSILHIPTTKGVVIAYKAEGSAETEPGESYDPDAAVADGGDDDENEEKPRFRNARRTPALYKVKYDAPSSFVAGTNAEEEAPPPIYMEDLTLAELEPALAAARKRLTSSIPQSQLQICGRQVVSYHATLDRRGDEALAMMISGLDDEGRDVDKLEGEFAHAIGKRFCVCVCACLHW